MLLLTAGESVAHPNVRFGSGHFTTPQKRTVQGTTRMSALCITENLTVVLSDGPIQLHCCSRTRPPRMRPVLTVSLFLFATNVLNVYARWRQLQVHLAHCIRNDL